MRLLTIFFKRHNGNPVELYKALFQTEPEGIVRIKKGPVSLSFICNNLGDYTRIYTSNFYKSYTDDKQRQGADMSGGVFIHRAPYEYEELAHTIIGVNHKDDDYTPEVIKHEEQHALNHIYIKHINYLENNYISLFLGFTNNFQATKKIIESYCMRIIKDPLERAKDEIIAYKTENKTYRRDIPATLTETKAEGGLYDYFDIDKTLQNLENAVASMPYKKELMEVAKEILHNRYKDFLVKGVDAVNVLEKKGYKEQEITALLMQHPLKVWSKIAQRVLSKDISHDRQPSETDDTFRNTGPFIGNQYFSHEKLEDTIDPEVEYKLNQLRDTLQNTKDKNNQNS